MSPIGGRPNNLQCSPCKEIFKLLNVSLLVCNQIGATYMSLKSNINVAALSPFLKIKSL